MKQLKIVINFKNLQKDAFSKENKEENNNILHEYVVEKKITADDPPFKEIKEKVVDPKPGEAKRFNKLDSLNKKKK